MSYGQDVMDKSISDRGLFERASMYLPGYRGYRDKNLRREVDKEVRREAYRSLSECKTDLAEINRILISVNFDLAKDADRIRTKADTYLKKVESVESGYSGLWEPIKVLQDELNEVIEWDAKLLESGAFLREKTSELLKDMDNGKVDVKSDLRSIERFIDDLINTFNERIKVIKGLDLKE